MFRMGFLRPEAAMELGYTGSQFRSLCNPESTHYDPVFAREYQQIEESGEHAENRLERLRMAGFKRALRDSDRLLEKLLTIYDPDWEVHRTQRVNVTANIETFVQEHFKGLNATQMKEILAMVQEARQRELEPVIEDAEFEES